MSGTPIRVLMTKTDPENYPRFNLPDGFSFKAYEPGMETEWAALMVEVDQIGIFEEAAKTFRDEFLVLLDLLPSRCFFVLDHGGRVAATASLWHGNEFGRTNNRIHYVATRPQYEGMGLAKALLTRLLDVNAALGNRNFLYLTTQTISYQAINIYMKFGFKPYLDEKPAHWTVEDYEEANPKAWERIFDQINEYKRGKQ